MPIGKNFTSVLEIRTVQSDLKVGFYVKKFPYLLVQIFCTRVRGVELLVYVERTLDHFQRSPVWRGVLTIFSCTHLSNCLCLLFTHAFYIIFFIIYIILYSIAN
jgi:hypothetical protein